jgi:hypothetical protein
MPTSLEAIAQKLEEKRKEILEEILKVSGSAAISKNDYGITVVDDTKVASSLIFKELHKDKYDNLELVKAINVEVTELKPNIPIIRKDLVPKPLYDEQVVDNEDLRKIVDTLTTEVQNLNTTISDLESQVQSEINNRLAIEQSNDVLVNQLDTLSTTIEDFATQIQNAVQKSVEESILRASLQSQNTGFKAQIEALIKLVDSLNAIIEGLQSQLGAVQNQQAIQQSATNLAAAVGGDVINDVVIVKFTSSAPGNEPKIKLKYKNARDEVYEWLAGETLDFTNNDTDDVVLNIVHNTSDGRNWFAIPTSNITIPAGGSKKVVLNFVPSGMGKWGKRDNTVEHAGNLNISVRRVDGSTKTKEYPTILRIAHPKSY